MKEILVLSGKGGTGKTTLTASFAHLSKGCVIADCDVDAPDLHLLLRPRIEEREEFQSGVMAAVMEERCTGCGICEGLCRFDAIKVNDVAKVDEFSCEGCGVCAYFCKEQAILLKDRECGYFFRSSTRFGTLCHAELKPGEENSGKLVAHVKEKARKTCQEEGTGLLIVDGPPGIGCPVIASFSGVNYVVIVTEPTGSGLHDLERVISLSRHFKVPSSVVINKWDLNREMSKEIEKRCMELEAEFLGRIDFDENVVRALLEGKAITEFKDCKVSKSVANIWLKIQKKIQGGKSEPRKQ